MGAIFSLLPLAQAALAAAAGSAVAADREAEAYFEAKVRPILVARCYGCHSEESGKQKGGLWLDRRETARAGGKTGPAVVPGDLDKSLLIRAIRYGDEELEMPPDEKLPAEEIAILERWVAMGAPDPRGGAPVAAAAAQAAARAHWAFARPRDVVPPACVRPGYCGNPIDRFVAAKLAEKGLAPAPPADRRTWLRRVTLDLHGLPPTPAEVDAFLADRSPAAHAKVVDRLLASSRYGERWGRHWLDVARYSDTKGYVFKEEKRFAFAYTYRDWVIDAFNRDLPYDRFVMEQLAADRLAAGEDKRSLAALGFVTLGRRFLNREPDIIDDRIDVVTRGFLGLTVTCARCHDHKYDPIPTADYYSLYGVFQSSREPAERPLIAPPGWRKTPENLAFEAELAKARDKVREAREKKLAELLPKLSAPDVMADYLLASHLVKDPRDPKSRALLADFDVETDFSPYLMRRWRSYVEATARPDHPMAGVFAEWHRVTAAAGTPQRALKDVAQRMGKLLADRRAELTAFWTDKDAPLSVPVSDAEKVCNRADREAIQALLIEVDKLYLSHPGAPPHAEALEDRPEAVTPRIFLRGSPDALGPEVPRQFLAVLAGPERRPFTVGSGRLELARAIASADNPLTARVWVNRVWQHLFGAGIVRTPSDFGLRGEPPTHPELLDWLARTFVEDGWSTKKLHRRIVLSATYRQSSDVPERVVDADPENRWLSRMNRRRLDFEAMRDALLAASGELDDTIGGRAVAFETTPSAPRPPEPLAGAEPAAAGPRAAAPQDAPASPPTFARRRSVYLFVDRQDVPAVMRDFDFASPDTHSPQRFFTSVPQQSLFLLNSPFVVAQARALLQRPAIRRAAGVEARVRALYRLLYGRAPGRDELALAAAFVTRPPAAGATLSAWEAYAQALLVSNEFMFVD